MKIHVCLVSAQAAANLLPALDPKLRPEKVVLVVTDRMMGTAGNLTAVLKESGITVEACPLKNEHDFAGLESPLLELAERLASNPSDEVMLNITGGTKLMSVVAQSVADAYKWLKFYVDVDTDEVIWLHRDKPSHSLTEQLRLRHYLRGYGFDLLKGRETRQATSKQSTLPDTLVRQIGSLEKPLGDLNWLAQNAKGSLVASLNAAQMNSLDLDVLLRNFNEAGCLTRQGNELHFVSEDDRQFVNGGWLETHVSSILQHTDLGIRDKAAGLEVKTGNGTKNELDVAFMARNRLFVIECKTARMDGPGAHKANDALFKLSDNCRRIGGLGTRGMLVSYRQLDRHEHQLAEALNIAVVAGNNIVRLDEHLKCWVRASQR